VYWQKIRKVLVQKKLRCICKNLEESWFQKFSGVLAKNLKGNGSKKFNTFWPKIIQVMVKKN